MAKRKKAKGPLAPVAPVLPDPLPPPFNFDALDTRIYGVRRPMSGECLNHIKDSMREDEFQAWKKEYLPLKCYYTDRDFTPAGKVDLLRQRGWTDQRIRLEFPELGTYLDGEASPGG